MKLKLKTPGSRFPTVPAPFILAAARQCNSITFAGRVIAVVRWFHIATRVKFVTATFAPAFAEIFNHSNYQDNSSVHAVCVTNQREDVQRIFAPEFNQLFHCKIFFGIKKCQGSFHSNN